MAKPVRQSVSLPARVARRVKALAQTTKTSTSRVIVDLIESGLDAREQERLRFFAVADRLSRSRWPSSQLARAIVARIRHQPRGSFPGSVITN